jgi:cytochrome c biogenesis protein CcmG/thiol:disulfide interchange protein DsbE
MDTAAPATRAPQKRSWVKVALILIPALLVIALLGWATLQQGSTPRPGDDAPTFSAPRLDGDGSVSLAELRGRPVLLNFWASWCLPCEDEAPILNAAERTHGEDVAFLGVNIKDARDDALEFERRFAVSYPSIRDEAQDIYDAYGLTGQPETFLIDAEGTIVAHIPGAIPDRAYLDQLLDAVVARSADAAARRD